MTKTHLCPVIKITELEDCPNSDNLQIVTVGGYTTLIRKNSFREGDLAVWIPPDSIVDTTIPQFSFLCDKPETIKVRIRAKKLRGIISYGLLVELPHHGEYIPSQFSEGDDCTDILNVEHYEPPISDEFRNTNKHQDALHPPSGSRLNHLSKFDVDALFNNLGVFEDGELVHVTEKIHGCNGKFTCENGIMYAGSRTEWKRPDNENLWWYALKNHPEIEEWCRGHENFIVYGEVYGRVQSLRYGIDNDVRIVVFDIFDLTQGKFLDVMDARQFARTLPWVPVIVKEIPFSLEKMKELATGNSILSKVDQIKEGIVLRPMLERWQRSVGRVIFKVINPDYYLKDK
jgi:RNA ligase (TIGR02306 family)